MRINRPDLSHTDHKIGDFLSADQLGELNPKLGIAGKKLSNMSACLNRDIDQLVKGLALLKVMRRAKRSNPDIDYQKDIEKAARNLCELIVRAPEPISTSSIFVALVTQLENISELFSEVQNDPVLAGFNLRNFYNVKPQDLRINFVGYAHDIYEHFTGKTDWTARSRHSSDRYSNLFFRLIKLCYECAGLTLGDSTIGNDANAAKRRDKTKICE